MITTVTKASRAHLRSESHLPSKKTCYQGIPGDWEGVSRYISLLAFGVGQPAKDAISGQWHRRGSVIITGTHLGRGQKPVSLPWGGLVIYFVIGSCSRRKDMLENECTIFRNVASFSAHVR
jgi:hypothetical protein